MTSVAMLWFSRRTIGFVALLLAVHVSAVPLQRQPILRKESIEHEFLAEQHGVANTEFDTTASVVRQDLEAACKAVNELEARVDGAQNIAAEFPVYEAALASWRADHPGEQPSCRVQQLSTSLCKDGAALSEMLWSVEGGSFWDARIHNLMQYEMNQTECQAFASVPVPVPTDRADAAFPLGSAVAGEKLGDAWRHADDKDEGDISDLQELMADSEYEAFYARAGHRAPAFGPPEDGWQLMPQGRFRMERVEHLSGLRILRKATPSMKIDGLQQVLTFGGGSGDAAAMLFDLGYRGTHLVYDHPAMLLMQRLWLRYSGVPVIMGEGLQPSADAVRKKVVLESSLGQKIFSHIDPAQANASLFRSTSFFAQEDATSFEKIRALIKGFGMIQFTFQPTRDDIDTTEYLHRFVEEDLAKSHNILTWRSKKQTRNNGTNEVFHFLAVLKNHGPLSCLKELNCMVSTLHPALGRRGNVTMEDPLDDSSSLRMSRSVVLWAFLLSVVSLA